MDVKEMEIAYIREIKEKDQCELVFHINHSIENIGKIDKEIHCVGPSSENVASLLDCTVRKIYSVIKEEYHFNEDQFNLTNIPIQLKNKNKPILPTQTIKSIIRQPPKIFIFQIFNIKYQIIVNAPIVRFLLLPVTIFANFTIQPRRYKTHLLDRSKDTTEFSWFKSKDKIDWINVGTGFRYNVQEDDVDYYLKLVVTPCSNGLKGPTKEAISAEPVEKIVDIPTNCPFQDRHKFTTNRLYGKQFRVVSYNTLSFIYSTNNQFPYCSNRHLAIEYRKQLIAKELLGYQADIICLQELDYSSMNYLRSIFNNEYTILFHKKGNIKPEGLACIFRTERFKLRKSAQIIFAVELGTNPMYAYLWNRIKTIKDVKDTFLNQITSLQITILEEWKTKRIVIIANTHLFYHPDAEHIRLLQANMATTFLERIKKEYSKYKQRDIYVIFCGDFNCVPTSSAFLHLNEGGIDIDHKIFEKIGKNLRLYHRFDFVSACGTPKYTNYTKDFKDCLDYIFIENNKMQISQVVPFPSEELLSKYEGLPNEVFPSDHLALVVDLEFL